MASEGRNVNSADERTTLMNILCCCCDLISFLEWILIKVLLAIPNKPLHCLIFGFAWTAWVLSVISLASYNWIAENIGSINGPYTYGLFMERATCSLCQPLQNPPPFVGASRAFMIMGCIAGFGGCLSDFLATVVFKKEQAEKATIACASLVGTAALFTLIGVAVFNSLGATLLSANDFEGTILPMGYGQILAWVAFVLYFVSLFFALLFIPCWRFLLHWLSRHTCSPYTPVEPSVERVTAEPMHARNANVETSTTSSHAATGDINLKPTSSNLPGRISSSKRSKLK